VTELDQFARVRSDSVQKNLDALQAQRDAEWTADHLAEHESYRQKLEKEADWTRIVQVGDVVAPFALDEVDGGSVVLADLVRTGPAVLIFFRFESCPACNAALPAYRDALAPELARLGAHLVAISPQVADRLVAVKRRLDLPFPVASDPDASLIRSLGIAFAPTPAEQVERLRLGYDNPAVLGNGRWDLPYPTVVVIDQDYVVRFADAHPNWMVRTEVDTILDAVRSLSA
jgi:peroxiredoxin